MNWQPNTPVTRGPNGRKIKRCRYLSDLYHEIGIEFTSAVG